MKIFKYPLQIVDQQTIMLSVSAKVLSVDNQRGSLCLWALVDPLDGLIAPRRIFVHGTGHDIPVASAVSNKQFIGTVLMEPFVWHVFEEVS